jgi:two-component sensor histidine kinase
VQGLIDNSARENEIRLEVENLDLRRLLTQAGIDAAEQKIFEALQRVLVEELHHRIKNTLATVMAIVTQSLRSAVDLRHGRQAIENRLQALGRVHDLLLDTNQTSAKLAAILKSAIEPFEAEGGGRFVVQGSNIEVTPAAVLPLAMVLNELCTNAVKYGALSNSSGRVEITAAIEDSGDQFRLTWTERGGPVVVAPTRRSFGTQLIEHSFVSQLKGEAQLSFEPAGVVCVLDIPIASLKPVV